MLLSSLISLGDESKYTLRSLPTGGSLRVQLIKACAGHDKADGEGKLYCYSSEMIHQPNGDIVLNCISFF